MPLICLVIIPLKDIKGSITVNAFQKIISKESEAESKVRRKPNKAENFIMLLLKMVERK